MAQQQENIEKASERNKETVKLFLETVRSGKAPDKANSFMADSVLAHQMNAEEQITVKRTPQEYSEHVREFLTMYGNGNHPFRSIDTNHSAAWFTITLRIGEEFSYPFPFAARR